MNRPLNKEQVKGLFEQEAVLMGTENCVPDFRAAALFGGDAVEHARKMNTSITGVAVITVICFLVGQVVKATGLDNKWIPIICGAFGAVLGILGMFIMPEFPASDYLTAAAVGIVSGLAATGINQVYKQMKGG